MTPPSRVTRVRPSPERCTRARVPATRSMCAPLPSSTRVGAPCLGPSSQRSSAVSGLAVVGALGAWTMYIQAPTASNEQPSNTAMAQSTRRFARHLASLPAFSRKESRTSSKRSSETPPSAWAMRDPRRSNSVIAPRASLALPTEFRHVGSEIVLDRRTQLALGLLQATAYLGYRTAAQPCRVAQGSPSHVAQAER